MEWPIRVLEDDLVRLEPVDVSPLSPFILSLSVRTSLGQLTVALSQTRMTLYLSTVITQAWNVVRPMVRTRLKGALLVVAPRSSFSFAEPSPL